MSSSKHPTLPTLFFTLFFLTPAVLFDTAGAKDPAPPIVMAIEVHGFTADAAGPLSAGKAIHMTLIGSPGDRASFSIPNVVDKTPMHEISPGVYEAEYTTTTGHDVCGAAILGELVGKDGTQAPIVKADHPISIDTVAPKLVYQSPAAGDRVVGASPVLFCGFDDGSGVGVDPKTVTIRLDGHDLTPKADISSYAVSVAPSEPLSEGYHTLFVSAADRAGNAVQDVWGFSVAAGAAPIGPVSVDRSDLELGDSMTVTAVGQAGGEAEFRVEPLPRVFPMTEVQPGRYEGRFVPIAGDNFKGASVVVRFAHGTDRFVSVLEHTIDISTPPPPAPIIKHPGPIDQDQGSIEMSGTAFPNLLVACTISYQSRSEGGVMPFSGALFTAVARADKKGDWRIGAVPLKIGSLFAGNRDTRILVSAAAVDASGNESQPANVRVDYSP